MHQTGVRTVPGSNDNNGNDTDSDSELDFSPRKEAKCRRILRSTDYYDILGVSRNCSAEDIKKAYRKVRVSEIRTFFLGKQYFLSSQLALQFHPDKTKCPSAEAAFKKLSTAYQCLSDIKARRRYDADSPDEDAAAARQDEHEYQKVSNNNVFNVCTVICIPLKVHFTADFYPKPALLLLR